MRPPVGNLFFGMVEEMGLKEPVIAHAKGRTWCRRCLRGYRGRWMVPWLLLSFYFAGCAPLFFLGAGAAAGIAGYKFHHGALEVIFQAPFIDTWDAALKALKEMEIEIAGATHDMTSGSISGRKADNTPVRIYLKYRTSRETEALIRVGPLGDRDASEAVKENIRKVLFGP